MGFNPLDEKGTPIEKQVMSWPELTVEPYDKDSVHPYTRTRIILMNGIEVEGVIFSHQFARHTDDMELKRKLAMVRRVEQQQQKMVNWMPPPEESTLAITLGYEQVAVDLTAWLARTEPDPVVKGALDFALLEDFDHLYRYANLMEMSEGKPASEVVGDYTEVFPGRPTVAHHRHPFDTIRKHYDSATAEWITKLHVQTIVAGEQQTMNFYMNVGMRPDTQLGRGLYLEIAQVEEVHVSQYESLADPRASWFERLVLHEYNECYMYYSCMESETDARVKKMWQRHLEDEITHLHMAVDLMKQYERKDPTERMPRELPELTVFQSNVDYVRDVLREQVDWTAQGTDLVPVDRLPKDYRFFEYQERVNGKGAPSQQVIEKRIREKKQDYRHELDGPHPVERFRARDKAVT